MSGFDENPFGEPVFNDPFKVNISKVGVEIFFHIFLFFLHHNRLSYHKNLTMNHNFAGSIYSTSSQKYSKQ
jgi:hypothetical protein